MNERFVELYKELIDRRIPTSNVLDKLKSLGDFSDDLLERMEEQLAVRNYVALSRMIHAVYLVPDRKFTPILCQLLDDHPYEGYMEAVADALIDIQDERSIPSILRSLDNYLETDADYHFNRKLVVALLKIGTKEAIDGIKLASKSPKELIRERAERALEELNV